MPDLEYDPNEYNILLRPRSGWVCGCGVRVALWAEGRIASCSFGVASATSFWTNLSNMFTNLNLTDMETCYKMFRADMLKGLPLREKRFGFEPEVTAKISRVPGVRIYEVGISYYGRTYAEGKKIGAKDGFRAIYCILKYNLWAR